MQIDPHLENLYWFFMMVRAGGPDGSELDEAVYEDAEASAKLITQLMEEDGECPSPI